jgi:hypothetical protein
VSDAVSRDEQSSGSAGGALRIPRLLALGATVTVAVCAGRMLLERRRAAEEGARDVAEPPADLATELRGAATELAVTLLDRATEHLERAKL